MLRLGQQEFVAGQFAVMAIVNRTPDSFYDSGANVDLSRALDAAERAVDAGADIVDVGGVRAGYGLPVDAEEELRRVLPVIRGIRQRFGHLVISVDTWRAQVAAEAIAAGADLVNDTWAGADPALIEVAASTGAGLVCSHTGGLGPRTDPHRVDYADVVADVVATVTDAAERLAGTLAATAISAWHGARVFRTHDVRETRHVLDMVASIRGSRPPSVARRGLA